MDRRELPGPAPHAQDIVGTTGGGRSTWKVSSNLSQREKSHPSVVHVVQ